MRISDVRWNEMTKMPEAAQAEWYANLSPSEKVAWDAKTRQMGVRWGKIMAEAFVRLDTALKNNIEALTEQADALKRLTEQKLR